MLGKIPPVNPAELRKQLIIAESEINRVQLLHEGQAIVNEVHELRQRMHSVSALGSAAALLVTGLSAYRQGKANAGGKASWWQTAVKGMQMAGDIWMAFRAH